MDACHDASFNIKHLSIFQTSGTFSQECMNYELRSEASKRHSMEVGPTLNLAHAVLRMLRAFHRHLMLQHSIPAQKIKKP